MKKIVIILFLVIFSGFALGEEASETTEQLKKLAENGDSQAQLKLGYLYFTGSRGFKDYEIALDYYNKAAAAGEVLAMSNICNMYWYGLGVKKNNTTAYEWCKKAEKLGSSNAMVMLGEMAMDQAALKPSANLEALQYFHKAADLDHLHAQYILGIFYERGLVNSPDLEKAIYWYKKSASLGHPKALDAVKRLGAD